jgi:Flp pilus assembly protein TadG
MTSVLDTCRRAIAHAAAGDRASVIVEFALTLPLLLLILMGVFDFGMAFQEKLLAVNAAREGARTAVLPGYQNSDVQARVNAYFAANGKAAPMTNVSNTLIAPGTGDPFTVRTVTVRFDHTFSFIGPIAYMFGGSFGTITLTGTSVMRTEIPAAP